MALAKANCTLTLFDLCWAQLLGVGGWPGGRLEGTLVDLTRCWDGTTEELFVEQFVNTL